MVPQQLQKPSSWKAGGHSFSGRDASALPLGHSCPHPRSVSGAHCSPHAACAHTVSPKPFATQAGGAQEHSRCPVGSGNAKLSPDPAERGLAARLRLPFQLLESHEGNTAGSQPLFAGAGSFSVSAAKVQRTKCYKKLSLVPLLHQDEGSCRREGRAEGHLHREKSWRRPRTSLMLLWRVSCPGGCLTTRRLVTGQGGVWQCEVKTR